MKKVLKELRRSKVFKDQLWMMSGTQSQIESQKKSCIHTQYSQYSCIPVVYSRVYVVRVAP
jgi:hypothetical protein